MCHSKIEVKRALLDMRYETKSLEKSRVHSKNKILWPLKLIYLTYIYIILHIVFAPDKILRRCTKMLGIQPFKPKVPASAVTETAVALQDDNNNNNNSNTKEIRKSLVSTPPGLKTTKWSTPEGVLGTANRKADLCDSFEGWIWCMAASQIHHSFTTESVS